jgi:hypothetical protein
MKNSFFIVSLLICCSPKVDSSVDSTEQLTYDGSWAENEEDNALFIIKGDSIQNVEHGDKMFFQVRNDTRIIDYVDFKGKYFVVKVTRDSLILQNPDKSITRVYKR